VGSRARSPGGRTPESIVGSGSSNSVRPRWTVSNQEMRVAIFSDIHGNLPALEAVLADVARRRPDAMYCLGDLVGYGPFPNEVIERIRSEQIPTITGNYDDGVGHDRDECGCAYREPDERRLGDKSFTWTKARVTVDNKTFLRQLHPHIRTEIDGKRVLLVHGSPRKINEYLFEDRPISSFQRLAASSNADVVVFGHTHKPYVKVVDAVRFVNVGSVGKPRTATGTPATQSSTSPRVHRPSSFGSRTTSRVSLMRFVAASCQANLQRISNTAVGLASRIHIHESR